MGKRPQVAGTLIGVLAAALFLVSNSNAQCQSNVAELHVTPHGTPGSTVEFTLRGVPFSPYILGTSQAMNWGAIPTCIDIASPSFVVLVNGLNSPFFSLNGVGEAKLFVQVPVDPSFMDQCFYFQTVTFPPAGFPDFSNVMGLTIGMDGFSCDPDTLALIRLDEGVGVTTQSPCTPLTATMPASVQWTAGVLGGGMMFNGQSELVFPDPESATTKTPGPFTIEAWVHMQPSDLPLYGGIHEVIRKNVSYCRDVYNLRFSRGTLGGPVGMEFGYTLNGVCAGAGGATVGGPVEHLITQAGWYHMVGQYDGVDEMKALFGRLGQPLEIVGTSYWGRIDPIEDFSDIHLGMGVGFPGAEGFIGAIDEVRISKVARY